MPALTTFITIADFKARLELLATNEATSLTTTEQTVAQEALDNAFRTLKQILVRRGFSVEQFEDWAQGREYQLSQAIYFYGLAVGWDKNIDPDKVSWLKAYDKRKECESIAMLLNDGSVATADDDGVLPDGGAGFAAVDLQTINDDLGI